jgi:hypothetical protein
MEASDAILDFFNDKILEAKLEFGSDFNEGMISDGIHTFDELYEFRKLYNAALFNEWGKESKPIRLFSNNHSGGVTPYTAGYSKAKYDAHKSLKHEDGEYCFGSNGTWFIVVAMLPSGQISNHYRIEDWDLFQIPTAEKAKYKFDGHTSKDVLDRLRDVILNHK